MNHSRCSIKTAIILRAIRRISSKQRQYVTVIVIPVRAIWFQFTLKPKTLSFTSEPGHCGVLSDTG
ncbi:hypothetical protein HOLleu_17938 [Holothuria leucospilota]|uniref:Uncharacterized protein n=1 Tax=Holothuria leucospilota TaxID=206669 RepID=A0A9Q1H9F8_HOLLE|nr:hypothetical protein HOLleu_17938 [Holothuria leucospilota]